MLIYYLGGRFMAESKTVKLNKLKSKKTQLQIQLTEVATRREMYHKTNDGSMHHFFSMRNSQHNKHRGILDSQIRNLKKKIDIYDRKIRTLEREVYSN
jgi:hypothetical protein